MKNIIKENDVYKFDSIIIPCVMYHDNVNYKTEVFNSDKWTVAIVLRNHAKDLKQERKDIRDVYVKFLFHHDFYWPYKGKVKPEPYVDCSIYLDKQEFISASFKDKNVYSAISRCFSVLKILLQNNILNDKEFVMPRGECYYCSLRGERCCEPEDDMVCSRCEDRFIAAAKIERWVKGEQE